MKTLNEKNDELPPDSKRRVMAEGDEIIAEGIAARTITTMDELMYELPEERRRWVR